MIYRVFCSNYDTEEKMRKVREKELALEIKYTSSIKEKEADSFVEAAMIFEKDYESEMNSLAEKEWHFFFLDSNGNICNEE